MQKWFILPLFILFVMLFFSYVAAASLQDGLLVYWSFDESDGTTASDVLGNGNEATLTGSASWEPNGGKIGGALKLDGSAGSSAEDSNGANYINGLTAFSVSVWVKSAADNSDRGIFHGIDPDGGDVVFTLRYDSAGFTGGGTNVIKVGINTTGGPQQYESASGVQTTEWQHLIITWSSGNQIALFINGELDEPTDNNDGVEGEITDATKFVIGKGGKDANASWNGLIDEVHLYNRVLDEAEITSLASGINVTPVEARGKLVTVWGNLKHLW